MVDPFTAFGLVGNILTFAGAGITILRMSYSLYKFADNAPKELAANEASTARIQESYRKMQSTSSSKATTGLDASTMRLLANIQMAWPLTFRPSSVVLRYSPVRRYGRHLDAHVGRDIACRR